MTEKHTIFDAIKELTEIQGNMDSKKKFIKEIILDSAETFQEALDTVDHLSYQFNDNELIKDLLSLVGKEFVKEAFSRGIKKPIR